MKLQTMEPPLFLKKSLLQNAPKLVILTTLALVVFTALPIYHSTTSTTFFLHEGIASPSFSSPPSSPPALPPIATQKDDACDSSLAKDVSEDCDIFSGEWVSYPQGPHYTNSTCWTIQDHQNCMRNGRKDTGYLKWRWKPSGCELPVFDPAEFLKILKGKSLAFVGDSVARNQMQSLLCLLSQVCS